MAADRPTNLGKCALLSMEMQRGVVGDLSKIEALVGAVKRHNTIANSARLMKAARTAGVPVIHCNAEFRADLKGSSGNSPLLRAMTKDPSHILTGSPNVETVPELAAPDDITFRRFHGLSPFTATSLDVTLRNMGVDTVLATGVSVNLGIFGLCLEAVNLGYRVILVRDCVAGFPDDYVDAVVEHSLKLLCTIRSSEDVIAALPGG